MENLKKGFLTAFHKIKKSFGEFLFLLLAIALIQCIFFTVVLSFHNNITTQTQKTEEAYPYHILITGLSESEMLILRENRRDVFLNDFHYSPLTVTKHTSVYYDDSYDMTIKIKTGNKDYGIFSLFKDDSIEANFRAMRVSYGDILGTEEEPSDHVSLFFSPLYYLEEDISAQYTKRNLLLLLTDLLGFVFLFALYRQYLSNQTFAFGIYATCGANSKRLRQNAVMQLFLLSLFSLLPTYYLAALLCSRYYAAGGSAFTFPIVSINYLLLCLFAVLPVLFLAVYSPIKFLSLKEPAALTLAPDANDLVASPRRSSSIAKRKFPFGYEVLSLFRFRKYHLMTALMTALICILFVSGMYLSEVYEYNKQTELKTLSDFTVRFRDTENISDEQYEAVANAKGTKLSHRLYPESMLSKYDSLLVIDENLVSHNVGFLQDKDKGLCLTADARFIAAQKDTLAYYESLYAISGNTEEIFSVENGVIIGSSYRNQESFSFSVGDTVQIAVAQYDEKGNIIVLDNIYPTDNETGLGHWEELYERVDYTYITLTVVGVIDDYPSGKNGIPLILSPQTYEALTGEKANATSIYVSLDSYSAENYNMAFDELSRICALLGKATVSVTGESFYAKTEEAFCYSQFIQTLSVLIFIFLPLVWFYAQSVLYQRRRPEFAMLYSLSLPPKKMIGLCLSSALCMLPICVVTFLLCFIAASLFSYGFNTVLPNVFHVSSALANSVTLSPWVYGAVLFALLFCVCISAFVPYYYFKKSLRVFQM